MDNIWNVVWYDEEFEEEREVVFSGSLADCEAYIRLKEGGYLL